MQFAVSKALAVTGLALLLAPPSISQEQCNYPTDQDVKSVADTLFQTSVPEGTAPPTVQDLFQVHFTCLATVALDMYAYATVVANFTITESSEDTVEQFQLRCVGGAWGPSPGSIFKVNLPAMPFAIETQHQCFQCEETSLSLSNYDPDSHCLCECVYACG